MSSRENGTVVHQAYAASAADGPGPCPGFLRAVVPASSARTALSAGAMVVLSLLAILGIYEFVVGRVGVGIFVSAGIESLLAIGFLLILIADRRANASISMLDGETSGDQDQV